MGAANATLAGGVRTVFADRCRLDACTATIESGASLTCDEDNFRIRVEKALTVEKIVEDATLALCANP